MKNLVVVESPAKAKTINKYLGKDFAVVASFGHVRDLLPKEGAVEPEHDFKMHYELIEKNTKHVDEIVKLFKKSDAIYLATDPDREGEAISWHIYEILQGKNLIKDKPIHRVVFHEITKKAIQEAILNPRTISMELVNAQQARRALDYLVGFKLSPLLWKKIRQGLSAGRVQSPALRLIVEREEEIEKFISQEYWSITANNTHTEQAFTSKLIEYQCTKLKQFSVTNAEQAETIKTHLVNLAKGFLTVAHVEKKQRKRNPSPPFITSTLQQEAARKLGFTAKRTMRTAQQLYEGIDTGEGAVGLITYMRTDSVNLADEALSEVREFISSKYGKDNLPSEPRRFKTKSKNAQEAHEAIRPTSVFRTPESIEHALSSEQAKLYELIWKRTVACQMIHATVDTVAVDLTCGEPGNTFRANGSVITNPGFIMVYQEGLDDASNEQESKLLPLMNVGDKITLLDIKPEQHFTEPPPRYSEATLIKALEEFGIGRPSTYASIISTIQDRGYAILDQKRFKPTDVGRIVNKFLTQYFTRYVDYHFTAGLENELDSIAAGEKQWIPVLEAFWHDFKPQLKHIDETVKRSDVTTEIIEEACPQCGKALSIRLGRSGRFIGCTAYPECDYTRNVEGTEATEKAVAETVADRVCPLCEASLVIRHGKFGKFIGCSAYPKCKHIEPLEQPPSTEVACPKCKQGTILRRKSKRGKIFFSCSRYPDCDYALWDEPIAEPCPNCAWPLLTIKVTKREGKQKICPQEGCGFKESVD